MAAITAQLVKELRDKTDAGMGECKKALMETNGDINAAIDYLRKTGIAKAENRAEKATKEGKIYVASNGKSAIMMEILCETDFVANNDKFIAYVEKAGKNILDNTTGAGDITEAAQKLEAEDLAALFSKFGEKMLLRRAIRYETAGGIGSYIHGGGKVGVMVEAEGEFDDELLMNVCLHIAAFSPRYLNSSEIPAADIEHEKEIGRAQLLEQGKKPEMIDKILIGKINKWYTDVCLVDQPWIHNDKSCLKKLYPKIQIKRFARWAVGQEI